MEKKTGVELIAEERKRQVEVEGWDSHHDDQHDEDELAMAAVCYATPHHKRKIRTKKVRFVGGFIPKKWPWAWNYWKPSPDNRIRELVKSGALIAAEIDRLQNVES